MGLAFGYAGLLAMRALNVSLLFGAVSCYCRGVRRVGVDLQRGEGCQGLRADRGPPVGQGRPDDHVQLVQYLGAAIAARVVIPDHLGRSGPLLLRHALCKAERAIVTSCAHARKAPGSRLSRNDFRLGRQSAPGVATRTARTLTIVFGATVFIAAVGFADDLRSIAVLPRLLLQALAVAAVVFVCPIACGLRKTPALDRAKASVLFACLWFVNPSTHGWADF